MHTPDIEQAIRVYYSKPEIDRNDIMELWGMSKSSANTFKNKVLAAMAEQDIKSWLPHSVNTRVAFEVSGIDIADYESRLKNLRRLKLEGATT